MRIVMPTLTAAVMLNVAVVIVVIVVAADGVLVAGVVVRVSVDVFSCCC